MFPPKSGSGDADVGRGRVEKTIRGGGKATEEVTCIGANRDEDVSKVHNN